MSARNAMQFIARVRSDEKTKAEVRALGLDPELTEVAAIGARMGLHFSVDELRNAYGYEWTMRALYYGFQKKEGT
ncbi:MAG TPA: Nif11-like leader peptide family natural product precursor [Candidatus Binataceae bacterium]|nr:Nif11-like leader peptide family natural product precursor [Candidatus Binataceae bacterium]